MSVAIIRRTLLSSAWDSTPFPGPMASPGPSLGQRIGGRISRQMNRRAFLTLSGACAGAGLPLAPFARLLAQTRAERPGPIVTTAGGRVRGVSDGAVRIFRGVPYGASTAGANRFQPPRAAAAWTGVRDAGGYGLRAFQPLRPMIPEIGDALTGSGPMSEDCLRLNVFTPGTNGRRPVMVWFHGGGQRTGSGNSIFYDGRELARQHDVVVVTTTHRLNAFAYLWLAGLPGTGALFADCVNLGLRDLVLALEWVRDNIARVRRRRGKRHHLRAVRRRRQDGDAHGLSSGARPVPSRHHHEHAGRDGGQRAAARPRHRGCRAPASAAGHRTRAGGAPARTCQRSASSTR